MTPRTPEIRISTLAIQVVLGYFLASRFSLNQGVDVFLWVGFSSAFLVLAFLGVPGRACTPSSGLASVHSFMSFVSFRGSMVFLRAAPLSVSRLAFLRWCFGWTGKFSSLRVSSRVSEVMFPALLAIIIGHVLVGGSTESFFSMLLQWSFLLFVTLVLPALADSVLFFPVRMLQKCAIRGRLRKFVVVCLKALLAYGVIVFFAAFAGPGFDSMVISVALLACVFCASVLSFLRAVSWSAMGGAWEEVFPGEAARLRSLGTQARLMISVDKLKVRGVEKV